MLRIERLERARGEDVEGMLLTFYTIFEGCINAHYNAMHTTCTMRISVRRRRYQSLQVGADVAR